MNQNSLTAFFLEQGTDHAGRTLADYRKFTHAQMEQIHDYIQWMFPTWVASKHSPFAPVLTEEVHSILSGSPVAQKSMEDSFLQMLGFYGLRMSDDGIIEPSADFADRSLAWRCTHNHNHLRIARILSSLYTLGHAGLSQELGRYLLERGQGHVKERTMRIWRDACRLPVSGS